MPRNKKDFTEGKAPNASDVRSAYFSGKLTTEEANDLTSSNRFARQVKPLFGGGDHPHNTKQSNQKASDFALDHEAYYAHKRAGLNP
jgi:hypothetical protein